MEYQAHTFDEILSLFEEYFYFTDANQKNPPFPMHAWYFK
jgi:hypothetical protein